MFKTGEPISAVLTVDFGSREGMVKGIEYSGMTEDDMSKTLVEIGKHWNDEQQDLYTAIMIGLMDHPKAGNFIMVLAGQQIARMVMEKRQKEQTQDINSLEDLMKLMGDDSDVGDMIGRILKDSFDKRDKE